MALVISGYCGIRIEHRVALARKDGMGPSDQGEFCYDGRRGRVGVAGEVCGVSFVAVVESFIFGSGWLRLAPVGSGWLRLSCPLPSASRGEN